MSGREGRATVKGGLRGETRVTVVVVGEPPVVVVEGVVVLEVGLEKGFWVGWRGRVYCLFSER